MSETELTGHDPADGQLPEGWEISPIGDRCKIISGSTPKTSVPEYWGGDIPWLTPDDLSKNRSKIVERGARSITPAGLDSCSTRLVPQGSVIFTSRAPIGYVAIAANEMCTNQGFKTAVPGSDIRSDFLYWQLQHVTPDIRSRASGTTFLEISGKGFAATKIVVPSFAEQERIVEILEEQLSRLDAALESVRVVREKAAQFRRSLLHAAFTGTLTGHNTADGQLPEGWVAEPLGSIAKISTGKTPSKFERRLEDSPRSDRTIPFFKVGDMNSADRYLFESRVYFADDEADFFRLEILEVGTIIFPKAGGAIATNKKRVLNVRGAIDLNCMAVTATNAVMSELIYWFFESFDLSTIADGSVLPQIGKRRVAEILIQFPESPHRQSELVEILEEQLSRLDAALAVADAIEKRSAALRRSLLHAAFTGRLTEQWRESVHV